MTVLGSVIIVNHDVLSVYSFRFYLNRSAESERPLNSLSALVCLFYLYSRIRFNSSLFTHTIRVQTIWPNKAAIFFLPTTLDEEEMRV